MFCSLSRNKVQNSSTVLLLFCFVLFIHPRLCRFDIGRTGYNANQLRQLFVIYAIICRIDDSSCQLSFICVSVLYSLTSFVCVLGLLLLWYIRRNTVFLFLFVSRTHFKSMDQLKAVDSNSGRRPF